MRVGTHTHTHTHTHIHTTPSPRTTRRPRSRRPGAHSRTIRWFVQPRPPGMPRAKPVEAAQGSRSSRLVTTCAPSSLRLMSGCGGQESGKTGGDGQTETDAAGKRETSQFAYGKKQLEESGDRSWKKPGSTPSILGAAGRRLGEGQVMADGASSEGPGGRSSRIFQQQLSVLPSCPSHLARKSG